MPSTPIHLRDLARERKSIATLAAQLIADVHGGEDLAQESIYRLLRTGAPRSHGNRLAWLRTTVRRLAANEYRGRASRQRREQEAARPEATLSSAQIAERAELCQRVHQAIAALPGDQANVLRDHYFGELAASEIAERDGLSINTVKSRIQRARTALRGALEREGLGGDVHWSVALAPLVASVPQSIALTSTLTGPAGAALIMKNLLSLAGVLAALLVGAHFVLQDADGEAPPTGAVANLGSAVDPAFSDDVQPTQAVSPANARASIAPAAPARASGSAHSPTTELWGRVVDSDGWPLPGVLVQLSRRDRWGDVKVDGAIDLPDGRVGFSVTSDRDGTFHFSVPFVGSAPAILDVTPGQFRTVLSRSLGADEEHELREGAVDVGDLTLAVAGAISGRVVDTDGTPIAGAKLRVAPSLGTTYGRFASYECSTGTDGSFVLGHAPIGQFGVSVEAAGFASKFVDDIDIERDRTTRITDVVLAPIPVAFMRGRILDETGQGIPRQWISAHPKASGDRTVFAMADDQGEFAIELKSTSPHMLNVERVGYEIVGGFLAEGPYREPTSDPITIQLKPLPKTTFKMVDAETGEAILVFGITVLHDCGSKAPKRIIRSRAAPRMTHHPDGVLVAGAREGVDLVLVHAEGYRPFKGEVQHDTAGEGTQTIKLRAAARATGRVLIDGEPAVGASVAATDRSMRRSGGVNSEATTAEDGVFVLDGLIPGLFRITARSKDGTRSGVATLIVRDELELEIDEIELLGTGSIEGTVLLPRGVNPEGLSVSLDDERDHPAFPVSSNGAFHIPGVEPGAHRVTLVERPGELVSAPPVILSVDPGRVTTAEIDARDCGMARVTLTFDIPGVPLDKIRVHIVHDIVGADDAQRARWSRGGITKMLKPDGVPGRVTGFERASGRVLIELYLPGRHHVTLPEPVLLLEPFGEVERRIHVELASLSIDLPESLRIPSDAVIRVTLSQRQHDQPLQRITLFLENEIQVPDKTWGNATFEDRRVTIRHALPGPSELSVAVYSESATRRVVTHADGSRELRWEGMYGVTLPVDCTAGETTHVSLPESPVAER